ncbi:AAA family ATPase [Selenomonas ruminantium]|uniref:Predicted ATP-binding protein involved in virulence n=1 Tax=Selenomonas ruminantium TaxID=971 RepID=A0A1H0SDW0_SELRU|nr:AAA family ATPase [Selenomonas ruminantium]SDP39991.1 Predicted ATP-binding protein involved in virulence [Selenomonas ruminantium]
MYLKDIVLKNYGPLKNISYSFQFNSDGTPKPTVFIGENGVGKTLLLSNITHSLIEIKRNFYEQISDVSGSSYYRVASKKYIYDLENEAYEKITYDNGASYIDFMVKDYEKLKSSFDSSIYNGVNVNDDVLKKNGFFIKDTKPSQNVFEREVFLYFPVERYYIPSWFNNENESAKFMYEDRSFIGRSNDSIIQYNLLDRISSWILDVAIDQALYERAAIPRKTGDSNDSVVYESTYIGKNTNIIGTINQLLQQIYANRISNVRFAIAPKHHGYRQIQIIGRNESGQEYVVVPDFSNLSSGEVMLFGIMAAILKEYDRLSVINSMSFDAIKGIVLIDEIDLHLHSDFLKNLLPNLISMFPKIQFIVTSHSPFFLLGMKNKFKDNCNFVTLPTGTITNQLERFNEIERCYAIVDENYKEVLGSLDEVREKLANISKPLIITEGKTDWKHIAHALKVFQLRGEFSDLDVEFLKYEDELGDSRLKTLLENLAKIKQSHKIIGVFDSDTAIGKKYIDTFDFCNNVYGCCIKDVHGYNCGISIELLYKREDLKRCDDEGRRIYLSDEFKEKSRMLKEDPQITTSNNAIAGAYKCKMVKVIDSDVFNSEEKSLALSKSEFADNVYNGNGEFANISVDGFKDIIKQIQDICNM